MDQLSDPEPVACGHRFNTEMTRGEITQEANLGGGTQSRADEIADLGDDQRRNHQRSWMGQQEVQAGCVVLVVGIDVGIEGTGIDDQGDGTTSRANISSIRSETSRRPLRPAAAASRVLRAPRWF